MLRKMLLEPLRHLSRMLGSEWRRGKRELTIAAAWHVEDGDMQRKPRQLVIVLVPNFIVCVLRHHASPVIQQQHAIRRGN